MSTRFLSSGALKVCFAVVLALLGVLATGRHLMRSAPKARVEAVEVPVSDAVQSVLSGGCDTYPTEETVASDIRRVSRRVEAILSGSDFPIVPASRRFDLVRAFEERMFALLDPDYMRDLRARVARGQPVEVVEPDTDTLQQARERGQFFALRPMDIQSVEVRTIYQQGRSVAAPATAEGFREGTTQLRGKSAFPLMGSDPEQERLDIVEVRLPMIIPIPPPKDKKTERRLVGFQVVWSKDRGQWIPWANKQYGGPNSGGSYGIPF